MQLLAPLARQRQTATVLVTHDLDHLDGAPGLERVALMADGSLGTPALRSVPSQG